MPGVYNFTGGIKFEMGPTRRTHHIRSQIAVIAVDRPGSGYSMRPDDVSARLGVQADTLAKIMRALGLKQPLLVGHSLGGALSLERSPNKLNRRGFPNRLHSDSCSPQREGGGGNGAFRRSSQASGGSCR
jgi:surfactin synthase thioesterase subunit